MSQASTQDWPHVILSSKCWYKYTDKIQGKMLPEIVINYQDALS
jgi:hypothetical protein